MGLGELRRSPQSLSLIGARSVSAKMISGALPDIVSDMEAPPEHISWFRPVLRTGQSGRPSLYSIIPIHQITTLLSITGRISNFDRGHMAADAINRNTRHTHGLLF